jgi:stage V sporulation protein R
MELIDQHTKGIMEGCKERAREAGLVFHDETLEYIVTNRDLIELGPKNMIPTLYDYWVHDIELLKEKGRYELYPNNPYETVINTHPPISFYNDNNPDWLNVMIFYHVLAHIDFFQNNMLFKHTWKGDFEGQALSDKRLIARLRSEKGRKVDYVIEFARGIDNLVGYYSELSELNYPGELKTSKRLDYYFDIFLQETIKVKLHEYQKEIDRYNRTIKQFGDMAESVFFSDILKKYPEFETLYEKHNRKYRQGPKDLLQYFQENSSFIKKEENSWINSVLQIIRNTSLYFQPQMRTKILNEGWASYWHEKLFLKDDRIKGNEVSFARVNAKVTALPRVGLNPYALGMRLFYNIEEQVNKGKLSYEFQKMENEEERKKYDMNTGKGEDFVFYVRENYSDFMFINSFIDQDFINKHKLFIAGKRLNDRKGVWEYYVKSRNADEYKKMILNSLYHPPHIEIDETKTNEKNLYLNHNFEGKPLVREYIKNTMMGIEYLWGGPVKLETTEIEKGTSVPTQFTFYYAHPDIKKETEQSKYQRVLYTMENRKLSRLVL